MVMKLSQMSLVRISLVTWYNLPDSKGRLNSLEFRDCMENQLMPIFTKDTVEGDINVWETSCEWRAIFKIENLVMQNRNFTDPIMT